MKFKIPDIIYDIVVVLAIAVILFFIYLLMANKF